MTVYVDDMRARYGRMLMSHMVADSRDELLAMADRIGVGRRHIQAPPKASFPHFDIADSKRDAAIKAGAVEVGQRCLGMMLRLYRERGGTGPLPTPDEARAVMRERREAEQRKREARSLGR